MGSIHTIWSTTAITNHLIAHVPSPAHEFKFTSRPKGIGGHLPLKCDGLSTCPWILQKMVAFCTLYIRKVRGYWHDDSVISALLYTFTLAELLEQRTSKRPWTAIQICLAPVYIYNSDWFRLDGIISRGRLWYHALLLTRVHGFGKLLIWLEYYDIRQGKGLYLDLIRHVPRTRQNCCRILIPHGQIHWTDCPNEFYNWLSFDWWDWKISPRAIPDTLFDSGIPAMLTKNIQITKLSKFYDRIKLYYPRHPKTLFIPQPILSNTY